MPSLRQTFCVVVTASLTVAIWAPTASAQVVPGSGVKVANVGDDFEVGDKWEYVFNLPKASRENDEQVRSPLGYSKNGRWIESAKRGQPDIIKIVDTPPGGLEGSKKSMLLRSVWTGTPNRPAYKQSQNDFIARGQSLSVNYNPSIVTTVYFPEWDKWEDRTGTHFGFRAGCRTIKETKKGGFLFKRTKREAESYWPGFFVQFNSSHAGQFEEDHAVILIRGNQLGHEIGGPKITEPGWYTMGMSFTPDGKVHFYMGKGARKLTSRDYITSSWPYGYKAQSVSTYFYNIVTPDNGKTWSTPWIVDDSGMYYASGQQAARDTTRR